MKVWSRASTPAIPHHDNMYEKNDDELDALGVGMLPRTLGEAIAAFSASSLGKAVFGDTMFDAWVAYKQQEWLGYLNHVADWERERYLKFF